MGCVSSLSAVAAVVTLAAGTPEQQPLRIGTGTEFPPYLLQDRTTGALSGLDYDLANALCDRMKVECSWKVVEFGDLLPGLRQGQFDFVIGGIAVTEERRQEVAFTHPYANGGGEDWFVGPASAPAPESARIAVISGTMQASWAQSQGYDVIPTLNEAAALAAVSEGRADLAFSTFASLPDQEAAFRAMGYDIVEIVHVPDDGVAIAVCLGNDPLLDKLNGALSALEQDGTLDAINTRWQ